MSVALLDVNVLVALAWPNHVHHSAASTWFESAADGGWATCAVTEFGFLRVSANRRVIPDARTPAEVIELLGRLVEVGDHRRWSDSCSPTSAEPLLGRIHGYGQVTDAHLLLMAKANGGALATFDRGANELAADDVEVVLLST